MASPRRLPARTPAKRVGYDEAVQLIEDGTIAPQYLECRKGSHRLEKAGRPILLESGAHERIYSCTRCQAVTVIYTIDRWGYVVKRVTHYDKEYRVTGHGGLYSEARAAMRIADFRRDLQSANGDEPVAELPKHAPRRKVGKRDA